MKDLLVFDMDGVLVDVRESYRVTIQHTVKHFTGSEPSHIEIQDWKNRGGFNDDWKLSHQMIHALGVKVDYKAVVEQFQKIFLGENHDGLILRERWLADPGLFDRLAINHTLAVFTGRLHWEADLTLNRFGKGIFDPIIGVDEVVNAKPDPEGLNKIRAAMPHGRCWYLGDTVDDARASRAAEVPFIGITEPANPCYDAVVRLLKDEGAIAVIDNINFLEAVIAQNV